MSNAPNIPLAARAPPRWKSIPRLYWIGGAIAAGLFSCLLCTGAGVGVSYVLNVGPMARPAVVVGKWEMAEGKIRGVTMEFKADGTGAFGIPDGVQRKPFKWQVTNEKIPVLIVDEEAQIDFPGERTYQHFTREGDTLTLTPLQAGFPTVVLRRVK